MKTSLTVVAGNRADMGLLRPLIKELNSREQCSLTVLLIADIARNEVPSLSNNVALERVNTSIANDGLSLTSCVANTMTKVSDSLAQDKPDALILLGDRYEIFAAAQAAFFLNIPIIHIHGGELTFGAIDDAMRHCITKMASLHFPSTEVYKKRILQLGEPEPLVENYGALAVDNISELDRTSKRELEQLLGIDLSKGIFLVTLHPETQGVFDNHSYAKMLVKVLERYPDKTLVITAANVDPEGETINEVFQAFSLRSNNVKFVYQLGVKNYLSILDYTNLVIGNSSSALIEVAIVGIPAVNIGRRQSGRLAPKNVVSADWNAVEIEKAIEKAIVQPGIDSGCKNNPIYGKPGVAQRMADRILAVNWNNLEAKVFNDFLS